jgi:hypothetical protein
MKHYKHFARPKSCESDISLIVSQPKRYSLSEVNVFGIKMVPIQGCCSSGTARGQVAGYNIGAGREILSVYVGLARLV